VFQSFDTFRGSSFCCTKGSQGTYWLRAAGSNQSCAALHRASSCKRAVLEVAVQNLGTALDRKHQLQQASMAGLASCFAANGHRTWKVDSMNMPSVQPVPQTMLPGSTPALWTGEWGECSANCGGGWQERTLLCEAAPGLLTELWRCPDAANTPAFRSCR
jgi:hypothetical protein